MLKMRQKKEISVKTVLLNFLFQDTLAEATALLTELENSPEMDTNGNNVASTPDSDTMVMEETSPSNQSDSHMSSIEEEKSQKSDGDNS